MRIFSWIGGLVVGAVGGAYIAQNYHVPNIQGMINNGLSVIATLERASRKGSSGSNDTNKK